MGNKKRSPVLDYTVYLVVRCVACVIQMLSWESARAVAGWLSWLIYLVNKRHRNVARENLRQAFPNRWSDKELDVVVRQVYFHFCNLLMEICLVPRKLRVYNHDRYLTLINDRLMVKHLISDKPLLIVTLHLGNWELAGYHLGLCGIDTYAIARTLDNPYLEEYLRKFRENTGQKILAKKGDFDNITQVLADGGKMATLGDQDAGKRGVFVDFFGRPASTHKAVALMAIEYDVPLFVSGTVKTGEPLQYQIILEEAIYPADYADSPNAIKEITQRFTAAMERLVRRAPEQYFWLHNRWKSQPAKSRKKAA